MVPAAPMNEVLDPTYEWDDVITPSSALGQQFGTNYAGQTIQNRDFYTDNWKTGGLSGPTAQTSTTAPFNGSTTCNAGSGNYTCGVGFGTLANRPTTCTAGVGYFATDQGNWNTSGNSSARANCSNALQPTLGAWPTPRTLTRTHWQAAQVRVPILLPRQTSAVRLFNKRKVEADPKKGEENAILSVLFSLELNPAARLPWMAFVLKRAPVPAPVGEWCNTKWC